MKIIRKLVSCNPRNVRYTSQSGEDLGTIAAKFGMPSWKYLYELNKDAIGDNPDLLKEGTKLHVPEWGSTSGDEKLKEKEADPFEFTGGLRHKYPWVPVSLTITGENAEKVPDFDEERELLVRNKKTKQEISKTKIKVTDSLEMLVPDSDDIVIGIEGVPLEKNGKQYRHANDEF